MKNLGLPRSGVHPAGRQIVFSVSEPDAKPIFMDFPVNLGQVLRRNVFMAKGLRLYRKRSADNNANALCLCRVNPLLGLVHKGGDMGSSPPDLFSCSCSAKRYS